MVSYGLAAGVVGYSNHFLRESISYLWVVALSRWTQYDVHNNLVVNACLIIIVVILFMPYDDEG